MINEQYILKPEGDIYLTEVLGKRFGFRKWTWGEKNALTAECSHMDSLSGVINFDLARFDEGLFVKTVLKEVDGKFIPFTLEEIRSMDGQLGERLFKITEKLNLVSNVETKNL